MAIKIGSNAVIDNNRKGTFNKVNFGAFTVGQLLSGSYDGSAVGDITYCTDLGAKGTIVIWNGSKWDLGASVISGGKTWEDDSYKYHLFTSPGSISSSLPGSGEAWVIAGGGGGGSGRISGGGGAGGSRIFNVEWVLGSISVTVGQGGEGGDAWPGYGPVPAPTVPKDGQSGGPSAFGSYGTTGGGGCKRQTSRAGGSGGGASSWIVSGGPGVPGQGFPGGNVSGPFPGQENAFVGTGGGGAGGAASPMPPAGLNSGTGGAGVPMSWPIPSAIQPSDRIGSGVAGGGSGYGGTYPGQPQGGQVPAHPVGGGGSGSYNNPVPSRHAKGIGAGGGGGGFRDNNNVGGGDGQPGVVILRYPK